MHKKEILKHIIGYGIGSLVFIILIPYIIYVFSVTELLILNSVLFVPDLIKYMISIPLFIIGSIFAIWSNVDLFKIGQGGPADLFNIKVSPRTKKLVVIGSYKYTRNPMVFGMNSIYYSIAFFLNSIDSLLFVSLFLLLIVFYLKYAEEKRLLKDFGKEYLAYKKKVSMIIPRIYK